MRKPLLLGIMILVLAGGLILFGKRAAAQNAASAAQNAASAAQNAASAAQNAASQNPAQASTPQTETRGDASRSVNGDAPDTITSLPMSNPYCYQPNPAVDQCLVNVRYWQANDDGGGNILAYVLFSLDGKLVYRSNAFFENFVTYSYDMIPGGIQVTCGAPNEGGFGTLYGKAYTVDVKAYDVTNAWVLDDQLQVKCPAYNP